MKIKFTQAALQRFGLRAINIISQRTQRGEGIDGKFQPYSTNPLAVPSGMATNRARKALQGSGKLKYFKRKGKLWMVIQGGYSELKKSIFANAKGSTNTPNLLLSGQMLSSLQAKVNGENAVTLTFDNPEAARKAFYQQIAGAGKGKALRRFLGLKNEELSDSKLQSILIQGAEIQL